MKTMRERLLNLGLEIRGSIGETIEDIDYEKLVYFIEQELKKEREEIVEIVSHQISLARYGNDDELDPCYERAFENIINTIKNRA